MHKYHNGFSRPFESRDSTPSRATPRRKGKHGGGRSDGHSPNRCEIVLTRNEVDCRRIPPPVRSRSPAGASRWSDYWAVSLCSRTKRVGLVASRSTRSPRDRRKSLNDLKPKAFSLNDGSIRFIWGLTAEWWSQSASSFSWPIRSARSSSPVAAACGSAGASSSSGSGRGRRSRFLGSEACATTVGIPGSASYVTNSSQAAASDRGWPRPHRCRQRSGQGACSAAPERCSRSRRRRSAHGSGRATGASHLTIALDGDSGVGALSPSTRECSASRQRRSIRAAPPRAGSSLGSFKTGSGFGSYGETRGCQNLSLSSVLACSWPTRVRVFSGIVAVSMNRPATAEDS